LIRTRFAPSPTGYLHIGGARTAIYDWLLAKQSGGKFTLRIEDTDRNRFVPGSLEDIMESLHWLGLDWDEGPEAGGDFGPYFQSERLEIYHRYAQQLIDEGKAYYCYCTPERLQQVRQAQEGAKEQVGYDRHCREISAEAQAEMAGMKRVIRFKTPLAGKTIVKDLLRGDLEFENNVLEDLVLIKSDGYPTYHFANVVDDHLMKVTHVLRGDEWLPSTPIHVLLYQAFGWEHPQFVHLSIFLSPDGKGKLSKRHGATSVKEYRELGYLPEAVFNFLLLLGWNPGNDQEVISKGEALKMFSLDRVNASPVRFATDKLNWYNGVYIRSLEPRDLAGRCLPFLQKDGLLPDPCPAERFEYLVQLMPLVQERLKLLTDITGWVDFFLQEEIPIPARELLIPKKSDAETALRVLEALRETIAGIPVDFAIADLEAALHALPEKLEMKMGDVFMPLRVAVSGKTATPGMYEMLHALGKDRTLDRVGKAIGALG
jgi:glutamyl-tRNA synthetase